MDAFHVAVEVLGGGHSSGLYESLREEMGATYNPVSVVHLERSASWMTLSASYETGKAVTGVGAVLRAIADLRADRVSGEAVVLARERLLAKWRESMASDDASAAAYAAALLLGVDPESVRDYPTRVSRVERDDVVRVAKQYLEGRALRVVFIGEDRWLDVSPLAMGRATMLEGR
jgi:predicted Zn-dependent peptidase